MRNDSFAEEGSGDSEGMRVVNGRGAVGKARRVANLGAARGTAEGAVFSLEHRLWNLDSSLHLDLYVHGRSGLLFTRVLRIRVRVCMCV